MTLQLMFSTKIHKSLEIKLFTIETSHCIPRIHLKGMEHSRMFSKVLTSIKMVIAKEEILAMKRLIKSL
jgi:hypothetical protein